VDALEKIGGVIGFVVYAYLMYRQNVLIERQNEIFEEQNRLMRKGKGATVMQSLSRTSRVANYWPLVTMAGMTILTLVAVGYDIHDRHSHISTIPTAAEWNGENKILIEQTGDLSHRTVPLDGYRLVNCSIDDSFLLFEGRLPSEMINCTGNNIRIGSHNPAIGNVMKMMANLCNNGGKAQAPIIVETVPELPPLPSP